MELSHVTAVATVYNDRDRMDELSSRLIALGSRGARIIVADDGSTDGTAEYADRVFEEYDEIRVLHHAHNRGVAELRNLALHHVATRYVWFCDSDDEWRPDILDELLLTAESAGADIAVAGARIVEYRSKAHRIVDSWGSPLTMNGPQALRAMLLGSIQGYLWNKLFRVEAVGETRFPGLSSQSDFAFTFVVTASARTVAFSPEILYTHLLRPGSVSQSARKGVENLAHCRDLVMSSPAVARFDEELRYFNAWFFLVPAARNCVRLPRAGEAMVVKALAGQIRRREMVAVARRDPGLLGRLLVLRLLGGGWPTGYLRLMRHVTKLLRARSTT